LFDISPMGMTVVIAGLAVGAAGGRSPGHAPADRFHHRRRRSGGTARAGQVERWEPEKSKEGPVSVIVSGRDQRVVVLRNGVEIGRARIAVKDPGRRSGRTRSRSSRAGRRQAELGGDRRAEGAGEAVRPDRDVPRDGAAASSRRCARC
jgi:hypothetical protein